MRICRFERGGQVEVGLYDERRIVPLTAGAAAYTDATHEKLELPASLELLDFLPPDGPGAAAARKLAEWAARQGDQLSAAAAVPTAGVQLLVPIPRPNKLFLLAGNYAEHIEEGGGIAAEREETFPYVFLKPPSTTLTDPGRAVVIPAVSPGAIDWEVELAVIIGRRCKAVAEGQALAHVAGYTVVNDISNRKFRPNPRRKEREKDKFFDWLHGKWFDSFCPCGPCVATPQRVGDPQSLAVKLTVNETVHQNASTAQQIFPVAAVIAFISSITTLEPGDIISTGTPAGVGNAKGIYLRPGDTMVASIERIGQLRSPVVGESA